MKSRSVSVLCSLCVPLVTGKPTEVSRCSSPDVRRGLWISGWARGWCCRCRADGGVGGAWNPGRDTGNEARHYKCWSRIEKGEIKPKICTQTLLWFLFKERLIRRKGELLKDNCRPVIFIYCFFFGELLFTAPSGGKTAFSHSSKKTS